MNQTTPFRNMRRAQYTAECLTNARMMPESYSGEWIDMLIHSRNDLLMCPDNPSFAGQIKDRDAANEHSQVMHWTVCRITEQRVDLAELDACTGPSPRHWMARRPYRHATDLENSLARLPWFMRRQAV